MNVALVSPYDLATPGGVQTHVTRLARALERRGHRATIVAPVSDPSVVGDWMIAPDGIGPDGIAPDRLIPPRIMPTGRVVAFAINGSTGRIGIAARLGEEVMRQLRGGCFDVVHLHEPFLPTLPFQVLRHSSARNIATFHAAAVPRWLARIGRPLIRWITRRLDGGIAVSPTARRAVDACAAGPPGALPLAIIPNGVDPDEFTPRGPGVPALDDGRLNLLYVGRLEPRKGLDVLFEAFRRARRAEPRLRLVVVGPVGRARRTLLRQSAGAGDVVFTGYVSPAALPCYYRACHVFCAPATGGESFGIVLLEAMASGLPIVVSDIPGYRAVVGGSGAAVLVSANAAAPLAEEIAWLARDSERRRAMGEAGRRLALDYAWWRIADRVLDVYAAADRGADRDYAGVG